MVSVYVKSSPSLALIKYWGKLQEGTNIPATSSLAVTLKDLETVTRIAPTSGQDRVIIDGSEDRSEKMKRFLDFLKERFQLTDSFLIESHNSFPKGAGLASSSSGYAALTMGLSAFSNQQVEHRQLSSLSQVGSGSAARSIFGGFTLMIAGKNHAEQIKPPDYWSSLRIIICQVTSKEKDVSSRDAMNQVRDGSIFYQSWLENSKNLFQSGCEALEKKNLTALGQAMQMSYKQMFATMLGVNPPILYWLPQSVELMQLCDRLRSQGINAWETMDAGPQVKILCLESDLTEILSQVNKVNGIEKTIVTRPGSGTQLISETEYRSKGE